MKTPTEIEDWTKIKKFKCYCGKILMNGQDVICPKCLTRYSPFELNGRIIFRHNGIKDF
jgi:hypothetical protein